jgi:cell shape-determining protein MreC
MAKSSPPAELLAEHNRALAAQRQLVAQVAALRSELASAREVEQRFLQRDDSRPLVQVVAVPARIIGPRSQAAEELKERLIDSGSSAGLAPGDLLVTSDAPRDSPHWLIDQGHLAALQPDWPVVSHGALAGRIVHVGAWTSTVAGVCDPEFRVGARIVRTDSAGPVFGAAGVYIGAGASLGELTLVPATEPVAPGDRVYTHETLLGASVLIHIGAVTHAEAPTGDPHWRIIVAPAATDPGPVVDVLKLELNPQRIAADLGPTPAPSIGAVR